MAEKQEKSISMKCGECLFFKSYPKDGKATCNKEGIREFAKAQSCFVPDIAQIITNTEQFVAFSALCNSYTPKQLKICIYTLSQQAQRKNSQNPLGTKIYICSGEDYLSNYKAAYILYYLDQETVIISGSPRLSTKGKSFIGYIHPKSIISQAEFEKKKSQLIKSGRINDPKSEITIVSSEVDKFEPNVPTIDSVPSEWLTKEDTPRRHRDTFEKLTEFLS